MNEKIENRIFNIGVIKLNFDQFSSLIHNSLNHNNIKNIGEINRIEGPFDGKINSIYHISTKNNFNCILRVRVSKAFRYENIVKEKILFPILDEKINLKSPNLYDYIQKISNLKIGFYKFESPIENLRIKIPNLYYFDETLEKIPYIYFFNMKTFLAFQMDNHILKPLRLCQIQNYSQNIPFQLIAVAYPISQHISLPIICY